MSIRNQLVIGWIVPIILLLISAFTDNGTIMDVSTIIGSIVSLFIGFKIHKDTYNHKTSSTALICYGFAVMILILIAWT